MNLLTLLPFESYTLTTSLSPAEVYQRLVNVTGPAKTFRGLFSGNVNAKEYEGEIYANTFKISRNISYRNSFLPEITGTISSTGMQTAIHIKMQPSIFVIIFMCFWLGIVGWVCLVSLFSSSFQLRKLTVNGTAPMNLIPFGMFIFGCVLAYFPFKIESKKSKAFLEMLVNGEEVV